MTSITVRDRMSVELIQHVGDDAMIVSAAKVSTGLDRQAPHIDAEHTEEADRGLINFLMKNRHGSPFEHGSMTFRVECPIFVAREFMRHRVGFSYNEESGRYKVLRNEFYVPQRFRPIVQVGKPGQYDYVLGTQDQYQTLTRRMTWAYRVTWAIYCALLGLGVAKEVARMVLPVGIYTSFYVTCNPRSLMHFLSLRTTDSLSTFPSYPMWEIESVARGMEDHFETLYPVTAHAFNKNGRVAP